tara:strand:+ start:446449 stop:447882 length:1434 start_codon:yes stop_codon:yes gene_type:complete
MNNKNNKTNTRDQPRSPSRRRSHAPTTISTPAIITQRATNALLPFGLLPTHTTSSTHKSKPTQHLLTQLQSAQLTLITGPSGAGKSTLLQSLAASLPSTLSPADLPPPDPTLPIVNLFNTPLHQTLQRLSSAGLAQPNLWSLPAQALSTGEHARLTLARLIDLASQTNSPTSILIDELATPLDRLTARSLCASINTLLKHNPSLRIIAAAAHEDLPTYLNTDLLISASNHAILPNQYTQEPIIYEPGTIDDYQALKHHHYLGADPASIVRIDRAMRTCPVTQSPILAGVLVVAYPTLNASWRDRAWPGRYTSSNKSTNAKRINTDIRRLARIIVEPRSRNLSIASTLVRNYLANPLTPATEALAAMGSTNPFLKSAGMTEYPIQHTPTDLRLLDTLHHLNQTPHDLLFLPVPQGEGRGEGLPSSHLHPLLQRELKTWARAKNLNPTDPTLPSFAAFKLLTQPRAYTHVKQEQPEQRA